MTARHPVVFLLDVDNTLLDNDRVIVDLKRYLIREVGAGCADHYFEIFEQLRSELAATPTTLVPSSGTGWCIPAIPACSPFRPSW